VGKGLSLAQGEYVWIAESDDFAAPQFLERLLSLAADHPSAGILYCQSCMVDEDGRELFSLRRTMRVWMIPTLGLRFFANGRNKLSVTFRFVIRFQRLRCLFRRDTFSHAGGPATAFVCAAIGLRMFDC